MVLSSSASNLSGHNSHKICRLGSVEGKELGGRWMGHSPVPRLTVWRSSAPDGKDPGSQVSWCCPLPTSLARPPHLLPPQAPGETLSRCSSQTHPGWCCVPCPFFFLPSSSFASFLPSLHNSAFGSLQEIEMPLKRASRKWKCIDSQS